MADHELHEEGPRGLNELFGGDSESASNTKRRKYILETRCKTFYENRLSIGAGEGNRTLVCSLGSRRLFKRHKGLAAKLA